MKHYLVLALAAFAFAIVAPNAFATRVIFDPIPSYIPAENDCSQAIGNLNNFTPCTVSKVATPYWVAFVDCTTLTGIKDPQTNHAYSGWCLYMDNVTGKTLNTFTFEFKVPTGGSYDGTNTLNCSSSPEDLATDDCVPGTVVNAGDLLKVSFFGPIANNHNFYLVTDFISKPEGAVVTVSVPEPGALGLFGLGLLGIGVGLGWRRRRNNVAA